MQADAAQAAAEQDAQQADTAQDAPSLVAPAGLNLLGDEAAGGCCGADGCCSL